MSVYALCEGYEKPGGKKGCGKMGAFPRSIYATYESAKLELDLREAKAIAFITGYYYFIREFRVIE